MPEHDGRRPQPDTSDVSAGWRNEYRAQSVTTDVHNETMGQHWDLPRIECDFCGEEMPNNQYPGHIPDCPARQSDGVRADGGEQLHVADHDLPEIGTRVVDQDADREAVAVVVDVHPHTPAHDYWIDELDDSVAGANPEYDAAAPIVTVAFEDELAVGLRGDRERRPRSWRSVPELASAAHNVDVRLYSYPAPRVREVE
jgi:hypothetical protein